MAKVSPKFFIRRMQSCGFKRLTHDKTWASGVVGRFTFNALVVPRHLLDRSQELKSSQRKPGRILRLELYDSSGEVIFSWNRGVIKPVSSSEIQAAVDVLCDRLAARVFAGITPEKEFTLESMIEQVSLGQSEPEDVVQELLAPDSSKGVGAVLDRLLQKINTAKMLDYYVGANWDKGGKNLRLYFSEYVDKEDLNRLLSDISKISQNAEIKESDDPDAKWMLIATRASAMPDSNILKGTKMDVDAPLSGNVVVTAKG